MYLVTFILITRVNNVLRVLEIIGGSIKNSHIGHSESKSVFLIATL